MVIMANTNIHVREKVLTNNFFNEMPLTPISYSTETTSNRSNLNIDAEKQRDRIHCSPLVHSDISMRYSLWLLGLHSAPCSLFRAKLSVPLQVFCTAWHLVTLLILLIGMVCGLIYGWNNKEDFNLHRLGRLIAHLSINTFVAFTSVGFFILGRMRQGLALYYKTLAEVEDYIKDLCIDLRVKRTRNVIIAIVFVSWLGTLANMGLRVLDFKDSDYDDVMVGSRIESTASASFLLALKTISRTALTVISLQWMPCQGYYATICTTVWVLASDYNHALDMAIENSRTKVLDNLEKYRQAHLRICNLVECVDSLLKWNFGILISLMTVVLLCVLYMASVTSFTTYIYYVLMAVASLATLIFFCDKVVDSVSTEKVLVKDSVYGIGVGSHSHQHISPEPVHVP